MRISKKILAIALSILMAVSMMPFTVFAATTGVANGSELKTAIAAAANGDVIEFTADNTTYPDVKYALVIPVDGKDITIDLKGHTQYFRVSGETAVSYPTDLFVLKNGAKLTVTDSVGGGAIYTTYSSNSAAHTFNVLDTSKLVIDDGKFVVDAANYGGSVIYQASAGASTTINGGEFTANQGATGRRNTLVNTSNGEVKINGGTFTATNSFDNTVSTGTSTALVINNGNFNGAMSINGKNNEFNGGTYLTYNGQPNTAVSAYLPADQIIDSTTGEIKNVEASTVARTNSAEFTSLKDALDSVAAGATATITLLDDCTLPATYEITGNQKITIDLNGNDITTTARAFNIRHGQLTIKGTGNLNANFTGANAAVAVYGAATDSGSNYSTFTLTSPATINAPNGYGAMIGANGTGAYGAKLQLGGTINSKYGVYINGNVAEPAVKTNAAAINITGTVTASNENAVVYLAGYAKTNIYSNANLTGGSGIYIKSGNLTVNGGTITANGAKTAYVFNTNGANGTGDAIIIDSCGYPGNVPTVAIKAGTVNSTNGDAVASYTKQDDPLYPDATFERVDEVIPGTSKAVFSSNVTELAADDYKTVYDANKGGYVIAPIAYGTVGLYQAGDATITGNGTAHEKITIANTSLNYASADYSVGRYYNGYYMGGVKFIAPEGTVISENARYTNGSVDSQTGKLIVKNLYTSKDGANYMYSWPHVTEESLKEAIDAGVNKTWTYTFDWDGDGYFEQEAIIELVCNSVKLVKDGEEVYPNANNGYSLTVDKKTSMNAYIDVNAYVKHENIAKLVVTYNNADELNPSKTGTTTEELYINDVVKDGEGRWIVNIVQAPAQIADEVKIEVIENGVVKREIVTSVADYLVQASTSDDESLVNLAKAMYDYGKATYEAGFAQNTHYVAPNNFTHAYFNNALLDGDVVDEAKLETRVGTACRFIELAYVATNTPSLRAYVGKRDKTNPYVYLTEDEAVAAGLDHVCISDATGNICVNLGSVNPDEFYKELEVRINDGASIKTNVLAYANLAYTSNNAQSNALGRSMFNYYTAARNYWA